MSETNSKWGSSSVVACMGGKSEVLGGQIPHGAVFCY